MDRHRYSEEDFNEFLQELIVSNKFNDSKEVGIAKLCMDKGFASLSEKQKYVFEKAIDYFLFDECIRCGNDIPWCEMSAAEESGSLCSWCQQLSSNDN